MTTTDNCLHVTEAGGRFTLRHQCAEGGCSTLVANFIGLMVMIPFLLFAFFFIGIPLLTGTITNPTILMLAGLLGLPSLLVVWYMLVDIFSSRVISIEGGSLRRYDSPLWSFTAWPRRIPLSELDSINRAEYTYGWFDALLSGETHLLGQTALWVEAVTRSGKRVPLLTKLSDEETEFALTQLNRHLAGNGYR